MIESGDRVRVVNRRDPFFSHTGYVIAVTDSGVEVTFDARAEFSEPIYRFPEPYQPAELIVLPPLTPEQRGVRETMR